MVKRATLLIAAVLVAATLVFAGCGQQSEPADAPEDQPKQASTSSTQPAQGTAATRAGVLRIPSEHGEFTVVLEKDKDVGVRFDLFDPASSKAYYDANEKRIQQLLDQPEARDTPINVTLTFNKPVPWEDFVVLRDNVGLQPSTLTFAERGPHGEKWALDVLQPLPDEELIPFVDRDALNANTTVLGVILVEASITPAPATLGVLASDPRVFAVDTVRVEAAQLLAQHGGESSTVDPSKIWVPSPYWEFDWIAQ